MFKEILQLLSLAALLHIIVAGGPAVPGPPAMPPNGVPPTPSWWKRGMEPPAWMGPPPNLRGYPKYGDLPEKYKNFVRNNPPGTPFPPELPPLLPVSDEISSMETVHHEVVTKTVVEKSGQQVEKSGQQATKTTRTKRSAKLKATGSTKAARKARAQDDKPTLYYDESSPQVRAILMAISALNVDVNLKRIDISKGEQMKPYYLAINPMHTVPTFKTGNLLITDSHAILIYLFQKFGGNDNPLWPDGDMRVEVLNRMFYSATTFFKSYSDVMSQIFKSKISAQTIKKRKYLEAIQQQYNNLNHFLSTTKYIACDQMTIADFSVATILSSTNILLPVDANTWPHLAKWFAEMKQMDFYVKGNVPGLEKLKVGVQHSTDFKINTN